MTRIDQPLRFPAHDETDDSIANVHRLNADNRPAELPSTISLSRHSGGAVVRWSCGSCTDVGPWVSTLLAKRAYDAGCDHARAKHAVVTRRAYDVMRPVVRVVGSGGVR